MLGVYNRELKHFAVYSKEDKLSSPLFLCRGIHWMLNL